MNDIEKIDLQIEMAKKLLSDLYDQRRALKDAEHQKSAPALLRKEKKENRRKALHLFIAGDTAKAAWEKASGGKHNSSNHILKAWKENYPKHYKHHFEIWRVAYRANDGGRFHLDIPYLRANPPLAVGDAGES